METTTFVAELFTPEPMPWGLRGDPHLWREMRGEFEDVPCPETPEELDALIQATFEELTSHPLTAPEPFYMKRHAHGGMSSGMISPEFWRSTALPLLRERLTARLSQRS
jgi:hypothetical protein